MGRTFNTSPSRHSNVSVFFFQSTSPCNISTVNALNNCNTSAIIRERGKFYNRRYWVIDMNEMRQLYLGTYSCINSIDRLIKIVA